MLGARVLAIASKMGSFDQFVSVPLDQFFRKLLSQVVRILGADP